MILKNKKFIISAAGEGIGFAISKLIVQEDEVAGIEFEYTENSNGTSGKLISTGEKTELKADVIYRAIGQTFNSENIKNIPEIIDGRINVDLNMKTSIEGVWAGGDCVKAGEDLTVTAVEHGKIAAESIHTNLS